MSSFLTKKKTKESYWDKIATEPKGTQRNKQYAVDNFFAYFPKAKYITNTDNPFETEKSVLVKLEKFNEPPRIKGEGDFVYPREGNFEFFIFDPTNIPDFDDLRTTLEFGYSLSTGNLIETESKYDSTISIKPADSLNSVTSSRNTMTFSLLGIAIALPSLIFAIRNQIFKS